jgi:hypothetical protein
MAPQWGNIVSPWGFLKKTKRGALWEGSAIKGKPDGLADSAG